MCDGGGGTCSRRCAAGCCPPAPGRLPYSAPGLRPLPVTILRARCPVPPQGGSEKLSDEAIEETLEKVVKLLAYVSDKVRGGGG